MHSGVYTQADETIVPDEAIDFKVSQTSAQWRRVKLHTRAHCATLQQWRKVKLHTRAHCGEKSSYTQADETIVPDEASRL